MANIQAHAHTTTNRQAKICQANPEKLMLHN